MLWLVVEIICKTLRMYFLGIKSRCRFLWLRDSIHNGSPIVIAFSMLLKVFRSFNRVVNDCLRKNLLLKNVNLVGLGCSDDIFLRVFFFLCIVLGRLIFLMVLESWEIKMSTDVWCIKKYLCCDVTTWFIFFSNWYILSFLMIFFNVESIKYFFLM